MRSMMYPSLCSDCCHRIGQSECQLDNCAYEVHPKTLEEKEKSKQQCYLKNSQQCDEWETCDIGRLCNDCRFEPLEPPKKQEENDNKMSSDDKIRTFATGATRDSEAGKLDYEGILSPLVIKRYAEYMHKHRIQADGTLRDSDNWQKGIPPDVYMKSMFRHFVDVWTTHRGELVFDGATEEGGVAMVVSIEESLCAVMFNAMGYMHEWLKAMQCDAHVHDAAIQAELNFLYEGGIDESEAIS